MKKVLMVLFFGVLSILLNNVLALEHDFTRLPLDSEGWTDLLNMYQNDSQYTNSRIIYVSSSEGDDITGTYYTPGDAEIGNNPFNPLGLIQPFATLSAAESYMRDGYGDIMLLKRGDNWTANIPSWDKSGASQYERIIIAAYGNESYDRPKTGQFRIDNPVDYIIIANLELDENERAMNLEGEMNHILIEDCYIPPGPDHGIAIQNINGEGGIDYLTLRRNVIAGRYRPSGDTSYTQGFYIDDSINLLIEENIIDDNGHDEFDVPYSTADLRSHNTYVMLGHGLGENHIWRYNVITRASSHGLQAGNGGIIKGNLLIQNPIALQTTRGDAWYPEGCQANVTKNVILHGIDISNDDRRGWGIVIANAEGQHIEDNIIAGNNESGMPFGIYMSPRTRNEVLMLVNNITIKNNIIHNWNGQNVIDGESLHMGGVYAQNITNIEISDNKFHTTNPDLRIIQADYTDSIILSNNNSLYGTRTAGEQFRINESEYDLNVYKTIYSDTTSDANQTIPTGEYGILNYLSSIGENATFDSFYNNLHSQRKGNWNNQYTAVPIINFVREKFGRDSIVTKYQENSDVSAEIFFSFDGESGYQYLGATNAHPGGGYFAHLGGNVNGAESVLPNPCSNRDTSNYHYTVLSNEPEAQGSVNGSQYSLKTPYAGYCNDESFTRDTTTIMLNSPIEEYYIRWYQKWTGSWNNANVQQKFTKFYNPSYLSYSTAHFSFAPNSNVWRNYMINLEGRFDMNGIPHAANVWIYETEEGAGNQYVGVARAWDDINNGIGPGGADAQFVFETDEWYCIEIHSKLNSDANTADAVLEAWVDGIKVFEVKNFKYYNDLLNRIGTNAFELQHIYYNRATNDNQPTYMDNIVVSDEYIGPITASPCTHNADLNSDCSINRTEINNYVNSWKSDLSISMSSVMEAINYWKAGSY